MDNELTWMPATEIREKIVRGDVSSQAVLEHFIERIERLNPTLKAFAHLDLNAARARATELDESFARGETPGPLHGLPISVKENLSVAGMPYSFPRKGEYGVARYDAIAVERLRAAGAIIVGTNTMMGTSRPKGVNARPEAPELGAFNWDAETRNPWDITRVPGWSSSGGAATAAARLLPLAIGSDGGGSTRLPAAFSGVVGVHPTRGLVPYVDYRQPKFRVSATNGALARNVKDAALVTQAMAGPDARDYLAIQTRPQDYLKEISSGVVGWKFAWTDTFGNTEQYAQPHSSAVIDQVRQAAWKFADIGASIDHADISFKAMGRGGGPGEGEPSLYEIEVGVNKTPMPEVDPEAYRANAEWRASAWNEMHRAFDDYDLVLSVTSQDVAPTFEDWKQNWETNKWDGKRGGYSAVYTSHTSFLNVIGLPAVSIPCGLHNGLPISLQIIGPASSEHRIFQAASAIEGAIGFSDRPAIS